MKFQNLTMSLGRCLMTALFVITAACAQAAYLTNSDVEKLLTAKMPDDVILRVIASGDTKFDTSPDALIALQSKGASPAILAAVVGGPQKPGAAGSTAVAGYVIPPKGVVLVIADGETALGYTIPTCRTAQRAMGYGGSTSWAQLAGTAAKTRASNKPIFIVSVPADADPARYVTLVKLEPGRGGVRQVVIGTSSMSQKYPGMHLKSIIPVTVTKDESQARAAAGFVLCKVTVPSALANGEYALTLATGELKDDLLANYQTSNAFYDFGI